MATDYRIDFTITRRRDGEDDFTDVGFGSSGANDDVDAALYEVQSIVQNRVWETEAGMPCPDDLDGDPDA